MSLNFLLTLIFPLRCVACRVRIKNGALCQDCRSRIIIRQDFICPICRKRLPEPFSRCHLESKFLMLAATSFEQPEVRELVHSLKYGNQKNAAEEMASLMQGCVIRLQEILSPEKTVFIPIPIHPHKERERGFNQSFLITKKLIDKYAINWRIGNLLKRIKNNTSQTQCKNSKERRENTNGIFQTTNPVKNMDLVLVDDVVTSGATIKEAVRTLKAAGAGRLIALVFAEA